MSEQAVNLPGLGPQDGRLRRLANHVLEARTVHVVTGLIAAAVIWRLVVSEGGLATILFAITTCATTGAVVLWATRRLLLSAVFVLAQVGLITFASWLKLKYMNMVFHAYDLAFYLPSGSTLAYLWDSYRPQVLAALAVVALLAIMIALAWRLDPTRVDRMKAGRAALVLAICSSVAAAATGERRHSQFEYEGMYLTNFYLSWSETVETFWRGQLIEAAPKASGAPLVLPTGCHPVAKPPHIILIHHESVVPPGLFSSLSYDRKLDPFFRSDDGQSYKLRVETYGGASTLTEFSVLTGLSTYAFGGMRQFVQKLMSGKIKDTLPQALTRCGYENVLLYPMLRSFTFADRFFQGTGIERILDLKDQKAKRVNERDRFYYDNAMNELDRHLAAKGGPMFLFVETMATHWPYDDTFEPHVAVPGGGPGTHPEMHEYLRRVAIAQMDFDHLRSELARRFPGEQFLIVRYGDHHPMATRVLLGFADGTEAEDVVLDRDSIAFQTFFAINGVNFTPRSYSSPPILDVPYLGTVLLEASGLPLSDSYERRKALKTACQGRSFGCRDKDRVLTFHRQLLDAGLVSAR